MDSAGGRIPGANDWTYISYALLEAEVCLIREHLWNVFLRHNYFHLLKMLTTRPIKGWALITYLVFLFDRDDIAMIPQGLVVWSDRILEYLLFLNGNQLRCYHLEHEFILTVKWTTGGKPGGRTWESVSLLQYNSTSGVIRWDNLRWDSFWETGHSPGCRW